MTDDVFASVLAAARAQYLETKSPRAFDALFEQHPERFNAVAQVFADVAVELGQDRAWVRNMKAIAGMEGKFSPLYHVLIRAQDERAARDLEAVTAPPGAGFFSEEPWKRPSCHRCSKESTEQCTVPNCYVHLCADHLRRDDDAPRCEMHEPYVRNRSQPKPPRRPQ